MGAININAYFLAASHRELKNTKNIVISFNFSYSFFISLVDIWKDTIWYV